MELLKNDIFLKLAIFLITLSIICQIVAGVLYQSMIQETDNMSATNNKLLKQYIAGTPGEVGYRR